MDARVRSVVYGVFAIILAVNIVFWFFAREQRVGWANVPPVPKASRASAMALGDSQLAYRAVGIMLQNLGDSGGRTTPLSAYDYGRLKGWFFLSDGLDPASDFVPLLAARYFGSSSDPAQVKEVVDYLEQVGQHPGPEKWRWLSHAVFLARHKEQNLARAFELAQILAGLDTPGMPGWTRMMPAFVLSELGEKDMAYRIMMNLLRESSERLHPNEVNHIIGYICEEILSPDEALSDPLCAGGQGR